MDAPSPEDVRRRLLAWFDAGHRDLPWRRTKDPYRILLAEYLLQRTRVATGTPYYERFVARFPDVESLASASEEEVLRAWEGLGFYRRARNLHAAAQAIVREHGGRIPSDAATLAGLPGIGPYTAGAVASIAFEEAVPAVDGNVTRVLARLFRVEEDVTGTRGRERIREIAAAMVSPSRPGPFNQALMELGATVCTPRRPSCNTCPFGDICLANHAGVQLSLPRMPAAKRPETVQVSFAWIVSKGCALLVRRGESELLGGLWSLPGGEGSPEGLATLVGTQAGARVVVGEEVAHITHTFSHRRWSGAIYRCAVRGRINASKDARWVTPAEARRLPLVPIHRKVLESLASRRSLESFDGAPRGRRR